MPISSRSSANQFEKYLKTKFDLLMAGVDDPDVTHFQWQGLVLQDLDDRPDPFRIVDQIKFRQDSDRPLKPRVHLLGFLKIDLIKKNYLKNLK